jgi:hypothetical protein
VNAWLAKPIHANWFIQARTFDLRQLDAAALFTDLPPWLRDHPPLPESAEKCCGAQLENFQPRSLLRSVSHSIGPGK